MRGKILDDLARTLATPMPRRKAVRAIGATLAMGAFQMLRPKVVSAYQGDHPCPPVPDPCAPSGQKACCVVMGPYNSRHMAGCYNPATEVCCVGANGSPPPMDRMSWVCPKGAPCAGKFDPNAKCGKPCARGDVICGTACCKPGSFCMSADQGICCKNGQTGCGKATCCDPATTFCCREPGDPKSEGRCCQKNTETCCGVGPDGAQQRMCCPKANKCVKTLPSTRGGFTKDSPWACCPPDRQVPADETQPNNIVACCAPGQVSLGGKLLVGQGIQGSCCDQDKICGSGKNLTCCPTGQSCIGGRTCA
jgi:hypothetical protein